MHIEEKKCDENFKLNKKKRYKYISKQAGYGQFNIESR